MKLKLQFFGGRGASGARQRKPRMEKDATPNGTTQNVDQFDGYDKSVAKTMMDTYGTVFLDEYGKPVDDITEQEQRDNERIDHIVVEFGNGSKMEYEVYNGKIFNRNDGRELPVDENNYADFIHRVTQNSDAKVTKVYKDEEEKRRKARENRPDYELEIGVPWRSGAGRTARWNRLRTRAMKRR